MNKENLLEMADYLDGDLGGNQFDMRILCYCALGHAVRHFGRVTHVGAIRVSDYTVSETMREIFGIWPGTEAATFLFAGSWGHKEGGQDPRAAAARFRYVAIHGDAPSRDQWERFETVKELPSLDTLLKSLDEEESTAFADALIGVS